LAGPVVTVAFEGVEARRVDVEVQLTSGAVHFAVVGLADKAVAESKERVRGSVLGPGPGAAAQAHRRQSFAGGHPQGRQPLRPADRARADDCDGVLPANALDGWAAIGELNLDGQIAPVAGALPAAMAANAWNMGLICPEACWPEAAWAGETAILAPRSLIAIVNHLRGTQVMGQPKPGPMLDAARVPDLRDVKGQEQAKRR